MLRDERPVLEVRLELVHHMRLPTFSVPITVLILPVAVHFGRQRPLGLDYLSDAYRLISFLFLVAATDLILVLSAVTLDLLNYRVA